MPTSPKLPPLDEYAKQFREKYGRDMTPDECRFYSLTRNLLIEAEENGGGESQGAA